jgi:hypothetical protein
MKTPECPIIFNGRSYYGIKEFDCRIIDLFTEKTHRGCFLTILPISDKKNRLKHKTKAKDIVENIHESTIFTIYSDWDEKNIIKIHNSLHDEILIAINSAINDNLLNKNFLRKKKINKLIG